MFSRHAAFEGRAGFDLGGQLLGGDEAVIAKIDGDKGADLGVDLVDVARHPIAFVIGRLGGQMVVDFHGGRGSAGFVEIAIDGIASPDSHLGGLLVEGQKQFLGQPPVEKGADAGDVGDGQGPDLSHRDVGLAHGGDGPVLGIEIDEHPDRLSRGQGASGFPFGEEDGGLAGFGPEVMTVFGVVVDDEGLMLSDGNHVASFRVF